MKINDKIEWRGIAVGCIIFILLFYFNSFEFNAFGTKTYYCFYIFGSAVTIFICGRKINSNGFYSVSLLDLLISTFLLVAWISLLLNRSYPLQENIIHLSFIIIFYFVVKQFPYRIGASLPIVCICLFLFNLILAVSSSLNSHAEGFKEFSLNFKALFDNSAILANFTACIVPYIFNHKFVRYRRIVNVIFFGLTAAVLICTYSRAAVISVITIYVFNFLRSYSNRKYLLRLAAIFMLVMSTVGLSRFKSDSVEGRELIWKITLRNIGAIPIYGLGYGMFSQEYPIWQAKYFGGGTYSLKEASLADNEGICFNEVLSIYCETGLLGLAVLLGFVVLVAIQTPRKGHESDFYTARLSMFAVLILSFFSYPLHIPAVQLIQIFSIIIFFFSSEFNFGGNWVRLIKMRKMNLFLLFASVCYFVFFLFLFFKIQFWTLTKEQIDEGDIDKIGKYSQILPYLKQNHAFLSDYGNQLYAYGDFRKCLWVLDIGAKFTTEIPDLMVMAKAYKELNRFSKSDSILKLTSNIVPNLFYPRFYLLQNYILEHDTSRALMIKDQILKMPIKINSYSVDSIRSATSGLLSP